MLLDILQVYLVTLCRESIAITNQDMSKSVVIAKTPEGEDLLKKRDELTALEEELAYGELEFHSLKLEMDSFQLTYMQAVGTLLVELDNINDQMAQIEAELDPRDEKLKQAAQEAHTRAGESYRNQNSILKEQHRIQPTEDLKKLYWEVARKIHPDLCTDENDKARRQILMVEANVAFEGGDEEKLRAILQEWTPLHAAETASGVAAELSRISLLIARVQAKLEQIRLNIENISNSELFELRKRVKEAEAKGRDLLQEMAQEFSTNIILNRYRLKVLTAKLAHDK